ncbi:hypothetical protein ABNG03_00155 [Halorubrum sp. RMP-47]|uniref:DUF8129 domain-containing protein n=1 Tax=Halorubrum miltondacostae TaxID=3076378 RepID=A0ABD5M1E7_9EURY
MPATGQHNEQSTHTPDPSLELSAEHGENPARFLDVEIHVDSGSGTSGELMFARIRGIQTIALVRYWVAMERRLASIRDRDPRERVLQALAQRERYLDEHGEGLPQTGMTPSERREVAAERDAESVAVLLDKDGEAVSWSRQEGATVEASR